MARLSSIEMNNRRRAIVEAKAPTRRALKERLMDRSIGFEERLVLVDKLARMPRNSSPVRVRNRCLLTGRSRGFYRKFQISRIALRELASSGVLPGVVKASW